MALYTPPSLPRTPSSCTMRTTLPSLPAELLATWSSWRPPNPANLLTPPMTSALQRLTPQSQVTSLPPITHFDRQLSAMAPLTPPLTQDASTWIKSIPTSEMVYHSPDRMSEDSTLDQPFLQKPLMREDAPHLIDWSDFSLKRSAHFIAEKTCEMICYLWFSTSLSGTSQRLRSTSLQTPSPPYSPETPSPTSALQFTASTTFIQFMQKVLETTQVSQSVIVLSLHYIYRLKERNRFTAGLAGSEFRIAVAALMMANKFLDDNTYTNKTWSEVSGIELTEINKMEREFLVGIDFGLYVDNSTYESWLNLLKGLVMAKERDSRQWRKSRARCRPSRTINPVTSAPPARTYRLRCHSSSYRARSTSPTESFTYARTLSSNHHVTVPTSDCSPTPHPGSKRSAADAFSPTSASFHELPPLKRPTGMTLQIPEQRYSGGANSASPLESLQSFAKMSLSSNSPHSARTVHSAHVSPVPPVDTMPHTLVAAYRAERPVNVPQNLYYYSLAGSSIDSEVEHRRKARLRCYQPPPPPLTYYQPPPPAYMPMDIQSASVSPHEVHMTISHASLPHFHDSVWSRKFAPPVYTQSPSDGRHHLPPLRESAVPSAPFANAGPPGVQFYTPSSQRASPVYPYNWNTCRR
ncbi:hypothetical protein SERLA73DRAFT_188816 [Serpula lacrymans var. lacrymans S7.3]|uniref:Cyclin-like domain-containing protein n=2 Tax=Serpula lacrymans var. lacrymans TaxID=341189 RepID=F8QC80_SERL3|nr:uncharacterized protein SERLADRAFT_479252 [Serpula lacrymans var. lacrymans S7.9]EGN94199.1 hypothetical protein SERLA73DRAFT_188816 [Serpula lacrymans var. lacrymans S7.3]EGO19624.1 hypothetical protein SERLADRAFT_479252 [Serpula lacrymans var. lacrymans S7.9]